MEKKIQILMKNIKGNLNNSETYHILGWEDKNLKMSFLPILFYK